MNSQNGRMASTKRGLLLFCLLLGSLVAFVPHASATVSATVMASPATAFTTENVVITYTKSSDNAGDGTQSGAVSGTWTGPAGSSGTLASQNYNFAGGASQALTWTFSHLIAGQFNFSFNDVPTMGTEQDETFDYTFTAPFTVDWTQTIEHGGATYDAITRSGMAQDNEGRLFVSYTLAHAGGTDTGTDSCLKAYDNDGTVLWTQCVVGSEDLQLAISTPVYDHGGRILTQETASPEGVLTTCEIRAYDPATGENIQLLEQTPSTCSFGFGSGVPVSDTDIDIYTLNLGSTGELERWDAGFDVADYGVLFSGAPPFVQFGDTRGIMMDEGSCLLDECSVHSFDINTGTLSSGVDMNTADDDDNFVIVPGHDVAGQYHFFFTQRSGGAPTESLNIQTISNANPPSAGTENGLSLGWRVGGDAAAGTTNSGHNFRSDGNDFFVAVDGTDNMFVCGDDTTSTSTWNGGNQLRTPFIGMWDDATYIRVGAMHPGEPVQASGTGSSPTVGCMGIFIDVNGGILNGWWETSSGGQLIVQRWTRTGIANATEFNDDAQIPTDFDPGTPLPPAGLSALVVDNTPTSQEMELRWPVSATDPDQSQGDYTYTIFVNGIDIGDDATTGEDGDGFRFASVVIGSADGATYSFQIKATDTATSLTSDFSCAVSVNSGELGDFDSCGDITGGGGGGSIGGGDPNGNPLEQMVFFLEEQWGFPWGFIIGAIIMAVCVVLAMGATNGNLLAGGLVMVLVGAINVIVGLWAEWALILMVLLVIALAGVAIFQKNRAGDEGA